MAKNEMTEPNEAVDPAPVNEAPNAADPMAPATAAAENRVLPEANEELALAHTDQDAPTTTKDDATDLGVPMLPGSPNEAQGPEDALGPGPKRGDYRDRIGPAGYHPHETVINADGKFEVVAQRQYAEDIADAPGKGGVNTAQA